LKAMGWLLHTLTDIWVIAFVICSSPKSAAAFNDSAQQNCAGCFAD